MDKTKQVEALKQAVDARRSILSKHVEAGKDIKGDVIRRDKKLLKRASRKLRKKILGRKISRKHSD